MARRKVSGRESGTGGAHRSEVQAFGGPWSLIKTEIVAAYLGTFTQALKNQNFFLTYIDAFAGSGTFSFDTTAAPLFSQEAVATAHAGSAQNALAVTPPFDEFLFIEEKATNIEKLAELIKNRPSAHIVRGDANQEVRRLCDPAQWRPKRRRGVIFLDPYGLQVEWSTLQAIAETQALDLWYLFPLAGLYRNAPLEISALDEGKRNAVARLLGDYNWTEHFYREPASAVIPLFGDAMIEPAARALNVDAIERFVHARLRSIFPHVEQPRRLFAANNAPLFSLFFAMSNPDPPAVALAKKIAGHILKRT